jgi:hypothetical protein
LRTFSANGLLDDRGGRWIELRNVDGGPFSDKIEGICAVPSELTVAVVVDKDYPACSSELCRVVLTGFRAWLCKLRQRGFAEPSGCPYVESAGHSERSLSARWAFMQKGRAALTRWDE